MKHLCILPLLLCGSFLQGQDKAALKEISAVYEEIEKNHELWPHHSYTGENLEGGQAYEHHVWQSDDDSGLIRVESLRFDDHGESKTQYFVRGDELLFVLDRVETTPMQPKAATTVEEKRYYFSGARLIKVLTKRGRFPAGTETDMSVIGNQTVLLAEVDGAEELHHSHTKAAQGIVAKAASLDTDETPPANAATPAGSPTPTGEGWRLIQGTRSHDDKFALAWGIKGQSSPEAAPDEDGNLAVVPDAENLSNYVVNLRTGLVMGTTGGSHFGDKPVQNHYSNEVAWSAADTFVSQVCNGKWATMDAHVCQLLDDSATSATVDLVAPATKAALKQLKGSPQLKKFSPEDFAISLHDVRFVRQYYGEVMQVGVTGQVPKSEDEDALFECTVTFTIAEGENGAAPVLTWKSTERHAE